MSWDFEASETTSGCVYIGTYIYTYVCKFATKKKNQIFFQSPLFVRY